jgi:hypothetical protein
MEWTERREPSLRDEDLAELAIGHVRADLIARYNKDQAWEGRCDASTQVSAHIAQSTTRRSSANRVMISSSAFNTRAEAKAGDGNKGGRLAFYRRRLNVAKLPP